MENESAAAIYGSASAPYINGLLPSAARANAFADPLPDAIPSEPHYVWMEAGTNHFSDATFTTDADPSAKNSTASTAHLSTQMDAASPRVSWLSYQEGLNASTGACPVRSSGFYAAKHDPYVFFQDVAGNPPSPSSGPCAAHHRAYTAAGLAQDLQRGTVAQYNFISPNVCHDMHGGTGCPGSDDIRSGDDWLAAALPPLIAYASANDGVIFIVWDEPVGGSTLIPFVAIGPQVKPGYASSVRFTHSSLTKTVEEIFGLPTPARRRLRQRPRRPLPARHFLGSADRTSGNWLHVLGSRKLLPWDGTRESRGAASSSWARRRAPVKPRPTT